MTTTADLLAVLEVKVMSRGKPHGGNLQPHHPQLQCGQKSFLAPPKQHVPIQFQYLNRKIEYGLRRNVLLN